MCPDQVGVDTIAPDILENAVLFAGSEPIEASTIEIGNTRDERKAERVAERKDEIADATAIDMMANDVEARVRFEKRVENMDGLARRGGDDFGMEGSISARDCRIGLVP